jgi:preprotein translocase subunit SecG
MLFNLLIGLHVLVCFVLILTVLLQSSKGGGLAGAFGTGGQTMFGGQETATFLSRLTTYLAVTFMVLSLLLAFLSARRTAPGNRSIVRQAAEQQQSTIPTGQSIDELLNGGDSTSAAGADTTRPRP